MSNKKKNIEWQEYEALIFKIYQELEPHAEVRHNDFIYGHDSKSERQIDISIRQNIAGHKILMIIQAKNIKRSADINVIGEFASVIKDVKAAKGVLICNKGFTKKAKEYAKDLGVDVCSVYDASSKNWTTELNFPVIKKSIIVIARVKHQSVILEDRTIDGIRLEHPTKALETFVAAWQAGTIPKEEGSHTFELDRSIIKLPVKSMPMTSYIKYDVSYKYHLKSFIPSDYRGIKDYISEKFKASFIEFNEKIPFLNDGTWQHVSNPNLLAIDTSHLKIDISSIDFYKHHFINIEWKE